MVMELEDVPGQLLRALEPIARFGGNIQSIVHQRERKTPLGRLPVMLVFEIRDKQRLSKLLAALRARGITVTQLGESVRAIKTAALLIGHIIHTDIRDTVDRLNDLRGVRVSDLSLAMSELGKESSARITITADDEARANIALRRLQETAERKNLLLITSLEVGE
jgi:ACT domain-containing protein